MSPEDAVVARLIKGVAWLIPYRTRHEPSHWQSNGAPRHRVWAFRCFSGWWPGSLRLRASGEHTIHPCPERSILCARCASTGN